jgi:hypothetical protein
MLTSPSSNLYAIYDLLKQISTPLPVTSTLQTQTPPGRAKTLSVAQLQNAEARCQLPHLWRGLTAAHCNAAPGTLQMHSRLTLVVAAPIAAMLLLAGGMRLGLGGEPVQAITLDSLNITNLSVMKVRQCTTADVAVAFGSSGLLISQ